MSNFFCSSIGKKFVMSITGLFLVLFLLFHMSMNLVAVISLEGYDMICEFLGANWYALVGTAVLAAGAVLHIVFAILLTWQNMRARGPVGYQAPNKTETEWAAKNMFVLGIIVLGFICLHLCNFWAKMQLVEIMGAEPAQGSALIVSLFSKPLYVVLYLIWLTALWFHLTHGFWSALQTIGWNNNLWIPRLKAIACVVATVIACGFAAVPIYFFFFYNA